MKRLLRPGNGNQKRNQKTTTQFIVDHRLVNVRSFDLERGQIVNEDGERYIVSAFTSKAALVLTPGRDRGEDRFLAEGCRSLWVRELDDGRPQIVYQINPKRTQPRDDDHDVSWSFAKRTAEKVWVCEDGRCRLVHDRT